MREQEYRARDKKVQRMTRDGLVEENRTRGTAEHISRREIDAAFPKDREEMLEPIMAKRVEMKSDESRHLGRRREGKRRRGRKETSHGSSPEAEGLPEGEGRRRLHDDRKSSEERIQSRDAVRSRDTVRSRDAVRSGDEIGKEAEKGVGKAVSGRLRYTREELRQEEILREGLGEKSGKGRVQNKDNVQTRRKRLKFERREQPEAKGKRGLPATKTTSGEVLSTAVRGEVHREVGEAEDENSGLKAAHGVERTVETGSVLTSRRQRHLREKPYRAWLREERLQARRNARSDFRKILADDPDLAKKPVSKWIQKQKIRRKYAAAVREAKKGAAHTANVLDKSGQVVRAAAQAVPKKTVFGIVAAGVLFVAMFGALFTSSGTMLAGIQSAIVATCYVADEEAINQSDLSYSEMETDLQLSINKTEEDFPGYDEYVYNVGEISHNPYELLGYLSAVYDDFTYAQVEAELERLFALQYQLRREEIVETRTREDENGEEEEYEWRILKTTLTVRPLSEIINASLAPGEQTDRYGVYMQTCGNRQCFGNPFDFSWISRVTSPYGYRVHPISGDKNLHRGIDIGMPEGTPIMAVQDGRVVSAGYQGDYGLCVVIEDDKGYQSKYAHCARVYVSAGQEVERGTRIAAVGNTGSSTGAHLHLEVLHNGAYLNPYFFVDSGGRVP